MPVDDVLELPTSDAEQRVLGEQSPASMIAAAESMLIAALPSPAPRAVLADQVVNVAGSANGPVSVCALSRQLGMKYRSLQSLFSDYVGVSPKWVIQRSGCRKPPDTSAGADRSILPR